MAIQGNRGKTSIFGRLEPASHIDGGIQLDQVVRPKKPNQIGLQPQDEGSDLKIFFHDITEATQLSESFGKLFDRFVLFLAAVGYLA
jgi:hypothetical protein